MDSNEMDGEIERGNGGHRATPLHTVLSAGGEARCKVATKDGRTNTGTPRGQRRSGKLSQKVERGGTSTRHAEPGGGATRSPKIPHSHDLPHMLDGNGLANRPKEKRTQIFSLLVPAVDRRGVSKGRADILNILWKEVQVEDEIRGQKRTIPELIVREVTTTPARGSARA